MARSRNLPGLLVLLALAGLALVLSRSGFGWLSGAGSSPDQPAAARPPATAGPAAVRSPEYPEVNLEALQDAPEAPITVGRNPFSLEEPEPVAPPMLPRPGPSPTSPAAGPGPGAVPGPAAPPPLNLKFIGIINLPRDGGRLAVLSDGEFVYHGRQGDIVEGRYRILSISEQSIELERTDGRGKQVLPLSGS